MGAGCIHHQEVYFTFYLPPEVGEVHIFTGGAYFLPLNIFQKVLTSGFGDVQ